MFFRKLAKQVTHHKKPIEFAIVTTTLAGSFFFRHKYENYWIAREIELFKSTLTPHEKNEMENSQEKNEEYKNQCKERLRLSIMSDIL